MSRTAGLREPELAPGSPSADEVRRQLENLLASPAFHGSKRCHHFLEYVCEKTLAGEADTLKERTIAIEVFGRRPESDFGEDSIVRVGAREVRKRLAQYYVLPDGASARVRIELPSGSYVPEFHYAPTHVEAPPETGRPRRGVIFAGGAVLFAALAVFATAKLTTSPDPNVAAFQRFWEPVFQSPDPMLMAVGHPIVYHPSSRATRMSEESLTPQTVPIQRAIQVPPGKLNGSDIVPVLNQYVGFGDMVAGIEISGMLASRSKPVRLRMASSVQFADLRQAQTLLIGAFTNRWTMELGQNWRFRFDRNAEKKAVIRDTESQREWSIPIKDDGSASEDYILASRIRNSPSGGLLLVAAGLKQFGTEAAGRLLADPAQLGPVLAKLPAGWESKNVQFVLHAKVIGNTPAQPQVVAAHVW